MLYFYDFYFQIDTKKYECIEKSSKNNVSLITIQKSWQFLQFVDKLFNFSKCVHLFLRNFKSWQFLKVLPFCTDNETNIWWKITTCLKLFERGVVECEIEKNEQKFSHDWRVGIIEMFQKCSGSEINIIHNIFGASTLYGPKLVMRRIYGVRLL